MTNKTFNPTKTFKVRSSATRYAKECGLEAGTFTIGASGDEYKVILTAHAEVPEGASLETVADQDDVPLPVEVPDVNPEDAAPQEPEMSDAEFAALQKAGDNTANAAEVTAPPAEGEAPKKDIVRRSVVEKPTRLVWDIAERMLAADPNTRRKTIIDACLAQGIAYYTARTQVQLYLTARKNDQAAAQKGPAVAPPPPPAAEPAE